MDRQPPSQQQQRFGSSPAARPAGDSPRDVPLSALSLGGNQLRQPNGRPPPSPLHACNNSSGGGFPPNSHRTPRLDLSAATGADICVRSPMSGAGSARHRGSGGRSARAPVLALELLSPAFGLDRESLRRGEAAGAGPAEVARQRAASGLGMPA